jgi:DNA-binding transcriptional ArsR family regulator
MKKGAGRALFKALSGKPGKGRRKGAEKKASVLSSPARKAIFEFLCAHPCAGASRVAGAVGLSIPTAQWHIAKMRRAGYLSAGRVKKTAVFYPPTVLSDEDVHIFWFLSKRKRAAVYLGICGMEGSTADELAYSMSAPPAAVRAAIPGLLSMGLATGISDGRTKRYYPTALLEARSERARKNSKAARNWLMKKLEEERLGPRVVRSTPEEFVVEMRLGARSVELRMVTDPYSAGLLGQS